MSRGNRFVTIIVCDFCGKTQDSDGHFVPLDWQEDTEIAPGYLGGGRHVVHRCQGCRVIPAAPSADRERLDWIEKHGLYIVVDSARAPQIGTSRDAIDEARKEPAIYNNTLAPDAPSGLQVTLHPEVRLTE